MGKPKKIFIYRPPCRTCGKELCIYTADVLTVRTQANFFCNPCSEIEIKRLEKEKLNEANKG